MTPAESEGDSLLALFTGANGAAADAMPTAEADEPPLSLYADDLAYCEAALHRLREKEGGLRFEKDASGTALMLDAPEDLRHRFAQLPPEVKPEHWRFVLTTDPARMRDAIARSRRDERTWPAEHYLWRLNPVVEWLNDRMAATFGRHEAPALAGVAGLASAETAFVLAGLVPNRRGHPLVQEWVVVRHDVDGFAQPQPFDQFLYRTGFGRQAMPNRRPPLDLATLEKLLPGAVAVARAYFKERRNAFEESINAKLNKALAELEELKRRKLRQLELRLAHSKLSEPLKQARLQSG